MRFPFLLGSTAGIEVSPGEQVAGGDAVSAFHLWKADTGCTDGAAPAERGPPTNIETFVLNWYRYIKS